MTLLISVAIEWAACVYLFADKKHRVLARDLLLLAIWGQIALTLLNKVDGKPYPEAFLHSLIAIPGAMLVYILFFIALFLFIVALLIPVGISAVKARRKRVAAAQHGEKSGACEAEHRWRNHGNIELIRRFLGGGSTP